MMDSMLWISISLILLLMVPPAIVYWRAPVERLRGVMPLTFGRGNTESVIEVGLGAKGNIDIRELPGIAIIALLLHENDDSSISQYLADHLLLSNCGALQCLKKLAAPIYAIKLERNFKREDLLTLYINTVSFEVRRDPKVSRCVHGLPTASQEIFSKALKDLSLNEFVFLIGIIRNPLWPDTKKESAECGSAFRYQNAFQKLTDTYRLCVNTWGWRILDQPEQITCSEALEFTTDFTARTQDHLPAQFENALRLRALMALKELKILLALEVDRNMPAKAFL